MLVLAHILNLKIYYVEKTSTCNHFHFKHYFQ
jgi:hypothetical protein